MKKQVALLLTMAMAAGMFSGCGADEQSTGSSAEEAQAAVEETAEAVQETGESRVTAADGEVTQVTFWNAAGGEQVFIDEIVEEFNQTIGKENNVELIVEHINSSDAGSQVEVAFQNGVEPDILPCASLSEYAEKGYICPLTEIPGLEELVAKNDAYQGVGVNVWEGKMYLLPTNMLTYGLAYNKDMFVEAGIVDENGEAKPPETIEEMVEDARILTDTGKQQFGACFPLGWGYTVNYYLAIPSQSSSGNIKGIYDYKTGTYNFEGIRDMTQAFLQMEEDGSLYPGSETLDNDPARARFAEGNVGMMMAVYWDCAVWNDKLPAKSDWGIAPIPVADAGNAYQQYANIGCSYAISMRGIEEGRGEAIALAFDYLYGDEMAIRKCEEGISIPWRPELVEQCDFSNSPHGWGDFCELVEVSVKDNYMTKITDLDGLDGYETEFINQVWSGKQSLDEWIVDMTERYNEGAERYMENNSEDVAASMRERMDPNLDISR